METGLKKQLQTAACEYETHTATLCIMLFKFFSSAILVLGNFKFVKIVQQTHMVNPVPFFHCQVKDENYIKRYNFRIVCFFKIVDSSKHP